jgi:hypothetical protein
MPEPQALGSARAAAAYAGLNPSRCTSGSSIDRPTRISRIGNATLRRALYFPALSALKHNPLVKALRERLAAKAGFKPKQIVAAAMRKLLHLCYGVLKTGERFDPQWPVSASSHREAGNCFTDASNGWQTQAGSPGDGQAPKPEGARVSARA